MKEFPRFSEAIIEPLLSQPQMKLLLLVLSHFRESLDTEPSTDIIKSALANAQQRYLFKFSTDYITQPEKLKTELECMLDLLSDSYYLERYKYQDAANGFLYEVYQDNLDPETFDLADGEILQVQQNG